MRANVEDVLTEAFEYFDNRSDIVDPETPNREMILAGMCRDALAQLDKSEAAIRADEREKCAAIVEQEAGRWTNGSSARVAAANLRARGNT